MPPTEFQPNPRHVGMPYPGVFVLDERGVVVGKRFHDSYRERDTGSGLIAQTLSTLEAIPVEGAVSAEDPVRIRAWLDSPTYAWFQRLLLTIEVGTDPGIGVYGHPAPPGFVPLTVAVGPIDGLEVGPATWSPSQPHVDASPRRRSRFMGERSGARCR